MFVILLKKNSVMTKIYILLLSIISLSLFSQKDYTRYYNSWRLGLNGGVMWQTADVRSCYGGAGGFTLEKGLGENATNVFSFAIRGRYLGGNTYGMSPNRNYNVASNNAYNGTYNSTVNYNDSVSAGKRYVYDNYKTKISEGSLELQLTFNRLREQKHVLLNLWGGIGFTSYRTNINMLDANGQRYNFSKIDSTGSNFDALITYNFLIDETYETNGLGSKSGNLVTLSPSGGIGLGYQFSPSFSMLLEYKVTVPQGINADLLDGKYNNNSNNLGGNNDYYHYTGLNLLFTLRGKKKKEEPVKNDNINNYTTTPINTVVPTNSIAATPTVVVINTPQVQKPIISYITPPVNGQVTTNPQYNISAQILNIESASQIKFYVNSAQVFNFAYNATTHVLNYTANLAIGNNPIQLIATNAVGNDNESTNVIYEKPLVQQGNLPTVEITNPRSCPFTSSNQQYNVIATTTFITNKNQITVKVNNIATANFSFNNGQISLPLNLSNGSNNVFISVTNNFGNDVASCNITYSPQQQVALPVITISNPPQSGYISSTQSYEVKATIINVPASNNISLYYNGVSTPFTYNVNTKQFSFNANLNEGSNSVAISAYNNAGEDNKATSILYNTPVQGKPPVVNLITPNQINTTQAMPLFNYKFGVDNVSAKTDITVTFNGMPTLNFTYNSLAKEILFNNTLANGTNTITVKANNNYGSDSKTIYVIYKSITIKNPPKVVFTNPATSPATGILNSYVYKATITNVINSFGLLVKYNGVAISNFTYNGSMFTYTAALISGNNVLEITATNTDGNDVASAIVYYKTKNNPLPPVVSLMKPMQATSTTTNAIYNFNMAVINVASQNNIEVTFNGVPTLNFNYNTTTTLVEFTSNLKVGNNTFTVKGTNIDGSDSKTVNLNYEPIVKRPPVVTINTPAAVTPTVTYPYYTFNFSATNVSQNQVNVMLNNAPITNFNFVGNNGSFSQNLKNGLNTLVVSATNNDGSASATAQVFLKSGREISTNTVSVNTNTSIVTTTIKEVTICYKISKNVNKTITIPETELENYLKLGATIGACATNTVAEGNDNNEVDTTNQKITICHRPPGNNKVTQTISVSVNAIAAHLAHGDVIGSCNGALPSDTTGKKITICHLPPGNTDNPQTITISVNALPAHLAHGDAIGACSKKTQSKVGVKNTGSKGMIQQTTLPVKTNTQNVIDTAKKVITQPININKRPR